MDLGTDTTGYRGEGARVPLGRRLRGPGVSNGQQPTATGISAAGKCRALGQGASHCL